MTASNKNIVITPNIGNTVAFPSIVYTGNANVPMTQAVADDNSIYWSNQTGQLFSIRNNTTTGTIFSVNDISGIPLISVDASGNISLNPLGGSNVGIGTASPQYPLHVVGNSYSLSSSWVGNLSITNTTPTTGATSGALVVAGGIGVANGAVISGNVGIGTSSTTGYTNNILAVFGNTAHAGNIYVSNTNTISGIMFPDGTFQNTAPVRISNANILTTVANVTLDLIGIVNRSQSQISVNDATRTVNIAPTGTSWEYYYKGEQFSVGGNLSLTIANTSGARFIHIDPTSNTLVDGGSTPNFVSDVIITYLYYNAVEQKFIIVGDERHGSQRDTTWHSNQHLNVGTVWRSGGDPSYTLNDDSNVTIGVSSPIRIADEDLLHIITNSATPTADYEQTLYPTASLEVLWLDGTVYNSFTTSSNFWVAGTSLARYNPVVSGSGSLADATEGSYITYWLLATNDIRSPVKMVMGRFLHASVDDAYSEEFTEYGLSFAEQVFMYQFVIKTSSTYTNNAAKIVIAGVRKILTKLSTSATSVSATEHNKLTGRDATDAHPISAITSLQSSLDAKQDVLVSGVNIKTINGNSILGSGDISQLGPTGPTGPSTINVSTTGTTARFYPTWVSTTGTNIPLYAGEGLSYNPGNVTLEVSGNILVQNSSSFGNVRITNTTAATSTTSGALTVSGGAGVAGSLWVGGSINAANINAANTANVTISNITASLATYYPTFVASVPTTTGNLGINSNVGVRIITAGGGNPVTWTGAGDVAYSSSGTTSIGSGGTISISSQTYFNDMYFTNSLQGLIPTSQIKWSNNPSFNYTSFDVGITRNSTNALEVNNGNAGVLATLFAGNINAGNLNTLPGTNANITIDPDGSGNVVITPPTPVQIYNTAITTSRSSGALIVAGGVGIGGNVYASNAYITSNVGIGTSDLKLAVVNIYGNNSTDVLRIRQDGTGNALVVSDAGGDVTPFLVDNTGNVGVGTSRPFALVHIGNTNAGTAAMIFDGGATLTTQRIGAMEYDGNVWYQTDNLTSGRGVIPHTQQFRLQSARAAVGSTTVPAAFFGPGANVGVLPNSTYEFEYHLYFLKTTNGTVTFRVEEAQAPVNLNATYYISNAVAGGGTASVTDTASLFNSTSAAGALPVTKTLTTALNYYARVTGIVDTHATTSGNIFLSYVTSAGTVTPLRGSYFKVTRLPTGNVGTFA